jgi:Fe-S cluster assembly iron-binding protein IscA
MSESSGIQLDVTQEAKEQVRELIKGQKPGTAVRVYLQSGGGGGGGGCSSGGCGSGGCSCGSGGGGGGPAFGMAFDKPRNGDKVIPVDGFSIVVDDMSAEFLKGATIDYVQDLNASGFKITSPSVPAAPSGGHEGGHEGGGCGCGSGGCGCG